MSKTVTIEFTDEQWEVIIEHFLVIKGPYWVDCESESDYLNEIKRHTNERVQDMIQEKQSIKNRKNQQDLFN